MGDSWAAVQEAVDKAHQLRDAYYGRDRAKKIQELVDEALEKLGPQRDDASAKDKARYLYLKGKAHEAFETYNKDAEDALSKAVKLDPSLTDAWNCLGHCYMKKKDYVSARNCFQGAMAQVSNKVSLRLLSMLLRTMGRGSPEERANVRESIQKAREAIKLDPGDSLSWQNLGNSHLRNFFVNSHEAEELQKALKAYQQAATLPGGAENADLHYNRSQAYRYVENWEAAVASLERAHELDPALGADKEVEAIFDTVTKTAEAVKNRGYLKERKLRTLMDQINKAGPGTLPGGVSRAHLTELEPGANSGKAVLVKVLACLEGFNGVPLIFVCSDSFESCVAVSVYNVTKEAIKVGDALTISHPYINLVQFVKHDVPYAFWRIRVDVADMLLVNGAAIDPHLFNRRVHGHAAHPIPAAAVAGGPKQQQQEKKPRPRREERPEFREMLEAAEKAARERAPVAGQAQAPDDDGGARRRALRGRLAGSRPTAARRAVRVFFSSTFSGGPPLPPSPSPLPPPPRLAPPPPPSLIFTHPYEASPFPLSP
eukprot:tig00020675_g12611.t1